MDFRYSETEQGFRTEVREFLKENVPDELRGWEEIPIELATQERALFRTMAEKGWFGLAYPKQYGGHGGNPIPMNEFILNRELATMLRTTHIFSYLTTIAPIILKHGSEEIKKEFLPRMLSAEIRFAICYTEPEAGNDLASMQTKAILDGDDYVVNGQKRFITKADVSDYMWAAVRTDPDLPKHKGVSLMIIKTDLPGITITPMNMASGRRTNEVFFDDVRVPKKFLIGEQGRGWYYMMEALDNERSTMINFELTTTPFEEFVDWLRAAELDGEKPKDDPVVRQRVANMKLKMQAGMMMQLIAGARSIGRDYVPNVEAGANKHWSALLSWEKADLAVDLMRAYGCLTEGEDSFLRAQWAGAYKSAGHAWAGAGGVDINRKIIAQRGLGLPAW